MGEPPKRCVILSWKENSLFAFLLPDKRDIIASNNDRQKAGSPSM
jgi:hypothetical protein